MKNYTLKKDGMVISDNVGTSASNFVDYANDNFILTEDFAAANKVTPINGISSASQDGETIPGAFDKEDWTSLAGKQPQSIAVVPSDFEETVTDYSNRVQDCGFEYNDVNKFWTVTGDGDVEAVYDPTQEGFMFVYADTYTGWHSLHMREGTSTVSQEVSNLIDGKVYRVNAWVQLEPNATMTMSVTSGENIVSIDHNKSVQEPGGENIYVKVTEHFIADGNTANLAISKTSAGAEKVLVDLVGIQLTDMDPSELIPIDRSVPQGIWTFEEGIDDSSVASNTTTLVGNSMFTDGRTEGTTALSFEGASYLSVESTKNISFGSAENEFSISAWIKTTEEGTDYDNKGRNRLDILAKGRVGNGNSANNDYKLYLSNGKVSFERYDQAADKRLFIEDTDGVAINDGKWHHVVFVNEGINSHKLYVDGQLVETSTEIWTTQTPTEEPLEIGRRSNAEWSTGLYVGVLDDVNIYQKHLTQQEISELFGDVDDPSDLYSITIGSFTNGTVHTSVQAAISGAEVFVTATPDEGYKLVENSLKANDDLIINNKFIMPESAVTIFAEFEPLEVAQNLALGKNVEVSSEYYNDDNDQALAKNLTDGDETSRWGAVIGTDGEAENSWATIDLGMEIPFNQIVLKEWRDEWHNNDYRAATFKISISNNNEDWILIHEGTQIGEKLIIDFDQVYARYVKIHGFSIKSTSKGIPSLYELEIYNIQVPESVDKTALQGLADTASEKVEDNYTPETWSSFKIALDNATAVILDELASQQDVSSAFELLSNALQSLQEKIVEFFIVEAVSGSGGTAQGGTTVEDGESVTLIATPNLPQIISEEIFAEVQLKPIMPKPKQIENTDENAKYLKQLEEENLKLRIENAYLKELRRLRLEEEALNTKRELSIASEENSD